MGEDRVVPGRATPVVMRRWLGSELERLRHHAGLTQRQAANALGWGLSKVGYVESGERPLAVEDLERHVLPTYGVPEKERPRLIEMAVAANARAWWDDYSDADLPRGWKHFTGLEQGATSVRSFEFGLFPGLLQTPDYAMAAIRASSAASMPAERVASIAAVRVRRQRALFDESSPLVLWSVLDEAVLRRPAGGPAVMRDQLTHVADLAEKYDNVTVQIIELSAGVHPAAHGPFTLFTFPWPDDLGMVFLENGPTGTRILDKREEVYLHSQVFDRLATGLALPPDQSIDMVRQIAGEYGTRAK